MKITGASSERQLGFTIIDLVAVVAAVALLVVFAFPLWLQSAAEARARLCAGNLAQMGRAAAMYAADHENTFPGNQHSQPSWVQSLASYCNTNSYRCPEELARQGRSFTVALNDFLTPRPYGARELKFHRPSLIPSPDQTLIFAEADEAYRAYDHFHFADSRENGYGVDAFADQVDIERHSGAANYLYVDGHVDELPWSSGARPRLTFGGSRFVHPAGGVAQAVAQK